MPTLLIKDGFKFFFYANEHEPKHVHVLKAGTFAKIELTTLKIKANHFGPAETRKILAIAEEHREDFERQWDEFFER